MKATTARAMTLRHNVLVMPIRDTFVEIERQAQLGNFSLEAKFHSSEIAYGVRKELQKLGYNLDSSSKQISPNESDYFLNISWDV